MTEWRPEEKAGCPRTLRGIVAALAGAICLLLSPAIVISAEAAVVNSYPPEVTGNAAVGERILCGAGTWSGPVARFSFAWVRDGIPIAGGTGVGYTIKREDEGHYLWCVVTAYEGFAAAAEAESANSIRVPGERLAAPVPTSPPVLSGVPRLNETLSCSTGGWSGSAPLTFKYQWVRDPGPEEALIEAATASVYTVADEDQGHSLACRVTASNGAGSASKLSNSASVAGTSPKLESAPRVLGTEPSQRGDSLSCTTGKWSGSPRPQYAYRWLRDGVAIASAAGNSYTVEAADQLHLLSCRVTATNIAGSGEASSGNSIRVRGSRPQNTALPSVTGTPAVGQTLVCEPGTWTGTPSPTLSYRWVRDRGLLGEETAGLSREYLVVAQDLGRALSCVVTARNSEGETSQSSEARVVPQGGGSPPTNESPPVVLGEAREGATLTCEAGTWGGSPEPALTYQWLGGGVPIGGATAATYRVSEADATSALMCRVTGQNSAGIAHADSQAVAIPGSPPVEVEQPQIVGSSQVGEVLTCLRGRWSGAPRPVYAFHWLRNGSAIAGAGAESYTVAGEDRGASLRCQVTASNVVGSAEAVSNSVQVSGNLPLNTSAPEVVGRAGAGEVLTCLPGRWSATPAPAFTYQWLVEGVQIPAATGNTYTVTTANSGLTLSCEVTASNREGSSSAVSLGVHVPGVKPENVQAPQLSGATAVGSALKCGPGIWAGKPPPVFSYEWFRDATAIPAATGATYTVELADQGHTLSCQVIATNSEGSAQARSANTLAIVVPAIKAEPKPETSPPPAGPPPLTAADIKRTLRVQVARMLHHVHLASLRRSASFAFPFLAPGAGTLHLFWYRPQTGARPSSSKPVMLALATTTYGGAGAKTVKLVLTAAARRLIRGARLVPLTIKGVFAQPSQPRVAWTGSYLLSH